MKQLDSTHENLLNNGKSGYIHGVEKHFQEHFKLNYLKISCKPLSKSTFLDKTYLIHKYYDFLGSCTM